MQTSSNTKPTGKRLKGYAKRGKLLKSLGFQTYADYLASDLWKGIRLRALAAAQNRCEMCQTSNFLQVHHKVYNLPLLQGLKTKGLVVLCSRCHHQIEFDNGKKRSLGSTQQAFGHKMKRIRNRNAAIEDTKRQLAEGYRTGALLPDKIPFNF